jgi:hypothetical protein
MHRTLTRLLASGGMALVVASSASADLSISLLQVGGTYGASLGVSPGDTLILGIDDNITNNGTVTAFTLVDPSLQFDPTVATFTGGVETGSVNWTDPAATLPSIAFGPIVQTSDLHVYGVGDGTRLVEGWEKATLTARGVTAPCLPGVAIFCSRLGNATSPSPAIGGVVSSGGNLGVMNATIVGDENLNDVTAGAGVSLGSFVIVPIPEPTTASLLGLGLACLAAACRRRGIQIDAVRRS